jgi:signal transduction histidine kinase
MAVFEAAKEILASPAGITAYYVLLFLAAGAGLWMAWSEWRRARSEPAQRWLVAMGGIIAVRVLFVVASLVAGFGWIDKAMLLPPLERFADLASIGFLAWALMPWAWRRARGWNWFFGANLVLSVAACVTFTILWAGTLAADTSADYNLGWQAIVWAVWQMALISVAVLGTLVERDPGWGMFLPAMLLLFAGALVQLLAPVNVQHFAIWQRAANLIAYLLVAVGIYQDTFAGLRLHSSQMQDISQATFDQIKSLLRVLDASQQVSGSLDLTAVLDSAVHGIARVLGADQCAVVFPEESDAGTMRLVAIHNPARQGRGESVTFPLDYQLTVQQAIRRRKSVVVEGSDNVQLKVLFALLGSGETGPLLVQPLLGENEALGAIIAGNSVSGRAFSSDELKLCQLMAQYLVNAIRNARQYRETLDEIARLDKAQRDARRGMAEAEEQDQARAGRLEEIRAEAESLRKREEAAREARNALEIQLASSRAEVEALTARLMVLETDLAQAHAKAEAQTMWFENESARMRTEWGETVLSVESSQNILYGMTAGVLVTDLHGVIQDANFAAEILLDRSVDELEDLPLQEVSSDERWRQAVRTASGGEAVRVTLQMGINTLMCDLAPLLDPEALQAEEHRLIVILQDVSAEVAEQRSQLEGMAMLAHELRTPITTIISYVDMLLSEAVGMVGSAQRKYLSRIKDGAERMAEMTDDMTRQAGIEEQWSGVQRQPVDVGTLIQSTVDGSHAQLEDREISLELKLPDDLPAIQADPDHLRHALLHLLSNACLASAIGGQVQVQAAQSPTASLEQEELSFNGDGFVVVSIRDSGGGLSEDALTRVFDRARPSRTPDGLGESGAELSLARTLVEAHGGRLWVESERGVGTTFSLVLPVNNIGERAAEPLEALEKPEEPV